MRLLLNKRIVKVVAMHFALIFLFHIWTPTISLALTSGPNQPEFTGFSTISTENMVDPFTGDFSYSVPLITIPGFQDGIPLVLNYQAGVTMEQEASWVGLGWSLNTGAINRSVRGLPDDFNGDLVTKRLYSKPNKTFSVALGFSAVREIAAGIDTEKKNFNISSPPGLNFHYNNYTGFGMGIDVLNTGALLGESMKTPFIAGLNVSLDTKRGASLNPSLDMEGSRSGAYLKMPISSRNGVESISFNVDPGLLGIGIGAPSVTASFLPAVQFPRVFSSKTYDGKFGGTFMFTTADVGMTVNTVKNELKQNVLELPAYGYLNLENAKSVNALMDFNRENDIAANKRSSVISNPIATNDVYGVNAPGFSDQMRVRRSDYGIFKDPYLFSDARDLALGADVELFPGEVKAGVNIRGNVGGYSSTSAMPVGSLDGGEKFDFNSSVATKENGFYQSAVLMSDAEMGVNNVENGSGSVGFDDGNALQVDIENTIASGKKMRLKNQYLDESGNNGNFSNYHGTRQERFKRNTVYQYVTFEENEPNEAVLVNDHDVSKQIHTIKALTPVGTMLEFGKPLFNLEKKEVMFSINHEYDDTSGEKPHVGKLTSYTSTEAGGNNTSGIDHMYSSYELPPYTYAHLLTNMYSADYVDLEGNGPTENDFGQYAHYEYRTPETYKWRAPYASSENQANFNIGSLATAEDDKGSYMYGKKEITYVHTIETKTHIAVFHTSPREDGLPVANEEGAVPTGSYTHQRKLDKIVLFAKGENYASDTDDKKEIKTAHLVYTYDLCDGIPNSSNEEGKLTLEKVYFTYYGNDKSSASLSPYLFDYHADDIKENPNWNADLIDNWGNYQPARFDQTSESLSALISQYPYPNQSDDISYTKRKNWAGVWNLKEITLPSGGKISVDYEQDDYQYVQNKKAMMMAKIEGFCQASDIGQSNSLNSVTKNIKQNYLYMILKVPKILSNSQADAAIEDIDKIYYKAYVRLKQSNGASRYVNSTGVDDDNNVHEYVEGYAHVDHASAKTGEIFLTSGNVTYIVVKLKPATLSEGYSTLTHPIRKSALMYLRFAESQLLGMSFDFNSGGMSLQAIGNLLVEPFMSIAQLFTGYYNMSAMRGYASQLGLNSRFPSFAKIHVPTGVKYAGGHRVSKITFDDQWANLSRNSSTQGLTSTSYTKEYIYRNYDKSSTGVATYEPMVASEENPLKQPIYYGADKVFFREMNLFVETPTGNSFYPGASVGYSKVIIKNKSHDNVSIGASGITEKEFYTAKDFPVLNDRTPLKGAHYTPPPVPIPFVGSIARKHFGFSQGVYVELNDMHGKPKSEQIKAYMDIRKDHEHGTSDQISGYYDALLDLENKAITSGVKYNYHTQNNHELASTVKVLEHGHEVQKEMGKTVEFYAASRQNTNSVSGVDYLFNATVKFPPLAVAPMSQMSVSDSYETYREYTTTKLITRKGIVKSVEVYDGLSTAVTENLVYDGETGEVILSRTNNEYDDPVYSYNIKGHSHYKGMAGAYKNLDYVISGTDYYTGTTIRDYPFEVGDILDIYKSPNVTDKKYWVKEVNYGTTYPSSTTQSIIVIDEYGVTSPLNTSIFSIDEYCRIIKSGNKNLLAQSSASITSLSNPLTEALFPLDFNGVTPSPVGYSLADYSERLTSGESFITAEYCADGQSYGMNAWVIPKSEPNVLQMYHLVNATPEVLLTVIFDKSIFGLGSTSGASASAFGGTFTRDGRYLKLVHSGNTYLGVVDPGRSKLSECLDGVLNAQATQFRDHLTDQNLVANDQVLNDVFAPYFAGNDLTTLQGKIDQNPYRYGMKGIYRAEKSSLYRIIREQEAGSSGNLNHTDIREDGVYDVFNFYSPVTGAVNTNWYEKATAVRYSPYSGEVESKNPLGIYSAAIFGYRNQLPTTIGQNARYFELAYTGLEEESTGVLSNSSKFKGHIGNVVGGSGASIIDSEAHTGDKCIQLTAGNSLHIDFVNTMNIIANKEYVIEFWVKKAPGANAVSPTFLINASSATAIYDNNKTNIEGWQLITMKCVPNTSYGYIGFNNTSSDNMYIDDIRISPANSAVKSYVYDRSFYRVVAELDSRHYATFYDYDEAGNLVQIKKETERGIMTVQTQRKSTNNH